jgi:hypothetical protein
MNNIHSILIIRQSFFFFAIDRQESASKATRIETENKKKIQKKKKENKPTGTTWATITASPT